MLGDAIRDREEAEARLIAQVPRGLGHRAQGGGPMIKGVECLVY